MRTGCALSRGFTDGIRQLRSAETRVASLERAWKYFLPDVDLDDAVATAQGQVQSHQQQTSPIVNASTSGSRSSTAERRQEYGKTAGSPRRQDEAQEFSSTYDLELDTSTPEALEWNETPDVMHATDGIGSLTLKSRASGYGYMGPQSGNSLLRYLQSVSNFLADEDDLNIANGTARLPQLVPQASRSRAHTNEFRNQCVDWYFLYFHKAYPILHEGCFRAQYMG